VSNAVDLSVVLETEKKPPREACRANRAVVIEIRDRFAENRARALEYANRTRGNGPELILFLEGNHDLGFAATDRNRWTGSKRKEQ
jgi:hypothetical protein